MGISQWEPAGRRVRSLPDPRVPTAGQGTRPRAADRKPAREIVSVVAARGAVLRAQCRAPWFTGGQEGSSGVGGVGEGGRHTPPAGKMPIVLSPPQAGQSYTPSGCLAILGTGNPTALHSGL